MNEHIIPLSDTHRCIQSVCGAKFATLAQISDIGIQEEEILKHIKLVWASLWSDAALAYYKELSLDITESAMSVIVQEMICGEKSGVAF